MSNINYEEKNSFYEKKKKKKNTWNKFRITVFFFDTLFYNQK